MEVTAADLPSILSLMTILQTVFHHACHDELSADLHFLYEIAKNSRHVATADIEQNPYFKNIKILPMKKGAFQLSNETFHHYELLNLGTTKQSEDGFIYPSFAVINGEFSFPRLLEHDAVWMSISPNEIETMKEPIAEAHGKVLTLGCGLGYYAYMVSLKENVESVTIIEKNQNVIDLFQEQILPQFDHKEKINIIKADAFQYMRKLEDEVFDYCFADIWQSNEDY